MRNFDVSKLDLAVIGPIQLYERVSVWGVGSQNGTAM